MPVKEKEQAVVDKDMPAFFHRTLQRVVGRAEAAALQSKRAIFCFNRFNGMLMIRSQG